MTISRFSGLLLLLLASCRSTDPASEPKQLGLDFCRAVQANAEPGAEALMSPALQAAVARLRSVDAAFRKANPGEKPPLGDGLRLVSFPDGLESCVPTVETPMRIDLAYAPKGDPAHGWHDRLLLARGPGGRLVISDIVYNQNDAQRFSAWLAENSGSAR